MEGKNGECPPRRRNSRKGTEESKYSERTGCDSSSAEIQDTKGEFVRILGMNL